MNIQGLNERKGKNYISYTYSNPDDFYEAGYRGLRATKDIPLLKCNYMYFNGMIRLIYHTNELLPLSVAISNMSPNAYANFLINMLGSLIEMKNSSFINLETVMLDCQNLYVDTNELKAYFIYVPISVQNSSDGYYVITDYIRQTIIYLIHTNANLNSELTSRIEFEIQKYSSSLEEMKAGISEILGVYEDNVGNPYREVLFGNVGNTALVNNNCNKKNEDEKKKIWFKNDKKKSIIDNSETSILIDEFVPQLMLINNMNGKRMEFIVDKKEFILGNQSDVNACIDRVNGVSRKHCKILNFNGRNYLVDLKSTNGTLLNGTKIKAYEKMEIAPGDKIEIAGLEFVVTAISSGDWRI